ncbi:MAG: peptidoglycan DD-metalloendopeptidase family protein [Chloroflexi bacterium]|nr:peptidoglycan DD-metalloendopeptidase family protein [Chloroflexota bacterium]
MRHRNRTEEIMVTVKVMGSMVMAVAFGLILTMGREFNVEADTTGPSTDEHRLVGDVTPSPVVVAQDNTATDAATLTATPAATHSTPTPEPTETPLPTKRPTATPTHTPSTTPSNTATDTPTRTATNTPTDSPTNTATLSNTRTSTPRDTLTLTPTGTFTMFPVTLTDTPTAVPCEPEAGWVNYVVQSGDTLSGLAVQFQTSITALQRANCLTTLDLRAGQTLYVPPGITPASTPVITPGSTEDPVWESLQGCSVGATSGSFPPSHPMGGDYVVQQEFGVYHAGIDLSARQGTPVLAAGSGTVIFAAWNPMGYGNTVVIAHGTTFTLYGHLNVIGVSCGQAVSTGQSIGTVGSTGWSSGPHLHFEVRDADGVPHNPRDYMDF